MMRENQGCLLRGNRHGSTIVQGADFIFEQYTYIRAHLWRNAGIVTGFWILFAALTAVGLEFQKPYRDGAVITEFKRGQTPEYLEKTLDAGALPPVDEEVVDMASATAVTAAEASEDDRLSIGMQKAILSSRGRMSHTKYPARLARRHCSTMSPDTRLGKLTAVWSRKDDASERPCATYQLWQSDWYISC